MKAVILVGGLGTRLRPLTLTRKKELMPLANRPYLEHALTHLGRHGVTDAILAAGHMAEAFDDVDEYGGVRVTVVREEQALDTCGAVKNVEEMLDDTFLVCNGDILTDLDVSALVTRHHEVEAVATIALTDVEDPSAYGLVPTDERGRIERFVEKPRADEIVTSEVNAGTYVLSSQVLADVPPGESYSIERQLFPSLLEDGAPLYGFSSDAYWLDIGTPAKYLRGNRDVLDRLVGEDPPGTEGPGRVWLGVRARVDPKARVHGPVVVGDDAYVMPGARIGPFAVVGPRCVVGEGGSVSGSVLHTGVGVGRDASVTGSILADGVEVGEGTRVVDAVAGSGADVGAGNELRAGIRVWPGVQLRDGTIRFS